MSPETRQTGTNRRELSADSSNAGRRQRTLDQLLEALGIQN